MLHGYAEHSGWYDIIGKALAEKGIFVFAHDHVGHGKSEGTQAIISDYNIFVHDILQHVSIVTQEYPDIPVFLLGHSMGGALSLLVALERPDLFKGIVLIGPAIAHNPEVATPFKIKLAKVVGRIFPNLGAGGLNPEWISRDKDVVKKYEDDPLNFHGWMKAGMGLQLFTMIEYIQTRLKDVTVPFLTIHGDQDKLTHVDGSYMLHNLAASTDKSISVYKECQHQVHNEIEGNAERCVTEIVNWITARL